MKEQGEARHSGEGNSPKEGGRGGVGGSGNGFIRKPETGKLASDARNSRQKETFYLKNYAPL